MTSNLTTTKSHKRRMRSRAKPKVSRTVNGKQCIVQHRPLKRIFDICFSLGALVITAPLFLVVSLLIKLSARGPIFFAHERVGRGAKPFLCYKFRTMYPDAQERLEQLLAQNADLKQEWEATHKLKNDPRVTPVGKFLRATSLDELPQFFNVLKGDLSVVGPRPVEALELSRHFGQAAAKVLSIRPGITGLWQTSGRNDTSYAYRVALDERYVDTQSFWLDLRLIARTVPAMLNSKGAY